MCYGMGCKYENVFGECTLPLTLPMSYWEEMGFPDDAICEMEHADVEEDQDQEFSDPQESGD